MPPPPAQGVARRILASGWWAGFTFTGITAYGDGHDSLIGGSVKDRVTDGPGAAASAAARAVAQQTPHQRALEVDHIVPRNQGGTGDLRKL